MTNPLPVSLAALQGRLDSAAGTAIGFPAATDIDFSVVQSFHGRQIINIGDPETDGRETRHAKDIERWVVDTVLGMFGGDPRECWGYVTQGGSTEGNLFGMRLARKHLPDAVLYYSTAAHYSVAKAADLLAMETNAVVIPTDPFGEIDYQSLGEAAAARPGRPAIVVLTLGTTETEAIDDVARVHKTLDAAGVTERYVHVDGALAGVPLALTGDWVSTLLAPAATDGAAAAVADSLCVSGHKFFATPGVCAVALARRRHVQGVSRRIAYIASSDPTISGARSGHSALELSHSLLQLGPDGHHQRATRARELAAYTEHRLNEAGWAAWRHPAAFTVVFPQPPEPLARRWALPPSGPDWARIVCMPGVTRARIDAFLAELGPRRSLGLPPTAFFTRPRP